MLTNKNKQIVYIDPWSKNLLNNRLFQVDESNDIRIDYLLPFIFLKKYCEKNEILLLTADKLPEEGVGNKKYLYYSFGQLERYRKIRNRKDVRFCSFYLFEPPIKNLPRNLDIYYELSTLHNKFKRVFTTCPVKAINSCYGTRFRFETDNFSYPQSHSNPIEELWNKINRKLLVMVNSYRYARLPAHEFYSERIIALKFFFRKGVIDLYGNDWNTLSKNFLPNILKAFIWTLKWRNLRRLKDFKNAFGIIKCLKNVKSSYNKYSTLSNYKFALCYESMGVEGFLTEKIFDCFFVGTIPIYLGDPSIENRIPANTFINKKNYRSYEELFTYINNMSNFEYETYRENIKNFLNSDAFKPFTMDDFAERFVANVLDDIEP